MTTATTGGALVGLLLFLAIAIATVTAASGESSMACPRWSPCFRKELRCPAECPHRRPANPRAKLCFLDCYSPKCEASCRGGGPDCNNKGSGCYDPRFIGGDGVVFYFHGKKDGHYALLSDRSFQVNARFIGLRPAGRTRDATWIQASGSSSVAVWDSGAADHIRLSYDGAAVELPEGHGASWTSPGGALTVERTGRVNGVVVKLEGAAEAAVGVVPVTAEDDRIHRYGIPAGDCFAHLEVQFRWLRPSPEMEGVLGRTYREGFVNPAKRGVDMAVLGGEEEYGVAELLSPRCKLCVFSPEKTAAAAEAE
ncbi:unnamed protein product [Spirodela intermedia]|uniref:Uncharacterized protein n=1 Tax=Spirodela intermedia TaxID=51605 RepID=A0A7I8JBJ6_SPIIN|nr:unnamed protein product [Spirodela intermedia]CAA6667557.1 unnamed protein product [Spirodela intermedia]